MESDLNSSKEEIAIITLGDSLSLPRPTNPSTAQRAQDAWPHLLKTHLETDGVNLHWHFGLGGWVAPEIVKVFRGSSPYMLDSKVKLVVAQFGIVDCTPRPIPARLRHLLIRLRSNKIEKKLRRNRFAYRIWGRPWTRLAQYRRSAQDLIQICEIIGARLIFCEIVPPGPRLERIVGPFDVEKYNQVLKDLSLVNPRVDLLRPKADLLDDGHHLSRTGHKQLANDLYQLYKYSGQSIRQV